MSTTTKKKNQSINQAPIRIWLYSSNSWHSLELYAIFFLDFDGLCTIVTMKMKNKNDVLGFLRLKYKTYEKMSKIEGQDEALSSVKVDSETAPSL